MNYYLNFTKIGVKQADSYQDRRGILLANYVSIILLGAICILYVLLKSIYVDLADTTYLPVGAFLFATPLILNWFSFTRASRLVISIVPTAFLWFIFIGEMRQMETIPVTVYDGLRIYLLAVTCIPYLVFTRTNRLVFVIALLPSFASVFFFEWILRVVGIGYVPVPGDDYVLMQVRFVLSYCVISLGWYLLQAVIIKNDLYNRELIVSLHEKTDKIESQNQELLQSRNQLRVANRDLECLLQERKEKLTLQRESILSYAHANAHHVRGPVARLMGLVELYKIDPALNCEWLLTTVDREVKEMDNTIRRISAELHSAE